MTTNMSSILVVDDSMANLLLLKDILSGFDYNVIIEIDGANVQNVLKNNQVDLILLDIMMPKIDGFEVCRRLKEEETTKDLPVIFLTAKVDEASLLKGFELGGVDYIKKPFLVSELMARVRTHILLKKANEALKNELHQHFITQNFLQKSKAELTIRNLIAEVFLNNPGNEVYQNLLQIVIDFTDSKHGIFSYINENQDVISVGILSDYVDYKNKEIILKEFKKQNIDKEMAETLAHKKPSIISKSYFFNDKNIEIRNQLLMPIIYNDIIIGYVSVAEKEEEYTKDDIGNLEKIINYISPILFNRIMADRSEKARVEAEKLLQENELKYRTLFNQNNDAVFIYNIEDEKPTNFQEYNDTAVSLFEYSRQELAKMNPSNLPPDFYKNSVPKKIKKVLTDGKATFEIFFQTKTGKIVPVEINSKKFIYKGKDAIMSVVRDVTERNDINKQIVNTIVETEEKERNRFAKDIHDGLGALLSSINTYINLFERGKISQEETPQALQDMKCLINEAVTSSKEIANNLMPNMLDNFGLLPSIQQLVKKVNLPGSTKIIFEPGNYNDNLKQKTRIAVFRIVSELINNALKHSRAKNAIILLTGENNYLQISYSDDGVGFDYEEIQSLIKNKNTSGMKNIKGRISSLNGEFNVESQPGKGTKINIILNTDLEIQ